MAAPEQVHKTHSVSEEMLHEQLSPPVAQRASERCHLLTIVLEDYYHNFGRVIERAHWGRFEKRVERSTIATLDLLDEFGIRATFFALGWVATTLPELIREVARRGHEIASKGYHQRNLREVSPAEFRDDLSRAREALTQASGQRVMGYRAPGWIKPSDVWALEVLAEEGYAYDSSIKPVFNQFASEPWRRFAHANEFGDRTLWEFPISTVRLTGVSLPIGAGNYFRQIPAPAIRRAVAGWERRNASPFTMYFHTWELDPDQPQITAAPWLARVRYYRNLEKVPRVLRYYFSEYRFTSIRDHLSLETAALPVLPAPTAPEPEIALAPLAPERPAPLPPAVVTTAPRVPVTIIVPCYNEEHALPYLANTLESVEALLQPRYALEFLFVDDCSTDTTWASLHRLFGAKPNCTFVRHERNQGVALGILTGIRHAKTAVVASIDCDCTYDPHELEHMIPLLTEGTDLVTGSPYHPRGGVRNVPAWRLSLSKSASALYRFLLHQKLGTYTSCFRVYRRSAVLDLELQRGGFLGIAEMIGKLDLAGFRVVEYPTTLNVRVLGYSKMKVVPTILGHLSVMLQLLGLRLFGARRLRASLRSRSDAAGVEAR